MSLHHGLRSAAGASVADPYFANTSLLLLGNGTNGGQNNTFVDGSSNAFSITRYGNTTQGTFSPFGYNWGVAFDGSGDYLSGPTDNAFKPGTGDFTVEAWIYPTGNGSNASGPPGIFDCRISGNEAGGFWFGLDSSYKLLFYTNTPLLTASTACALNAWHHVAITRSGSTVTLWLNGSSVGTLTNSTNFTTGGCYVGMAYTGVNNPFMGNIASLRVLKGTAQYSSTFTPSTTPLTAITNTSLLTCQSNRFIDNSSNAFTITPYGDAKVTNFAPFATGSEYSTGTNGGSGYFDGSGDYLTIPSNTALDLGTGDFTVEAWVYLKSTASDWFVISSTGSGGLFFGYTNTTTPGWGYGRTAVAWDYRTGVTSSTDAWHHVAMTRSGTSIRFFVNGTQAGTTQTSSQSYDLGTTSTSVGSQGAAYYLNGNISSLRVLKGTAQYTANFTPSTTPLTAITNTSLLLNFVNGSIIDSTGKNDIETVGDAQISTSVKKFGTGSLKFDGTDDALSFPSGSHLAFGTGDYTVEGWFYLSATSSYRTIFVSGTAGNSGNFACYFYNGTTLEIYQNGVSPAKFSGSCSVSTNTWFHLAITRSSGTVRVFLDGVQQSSGTDTYSYASTSNARVGNDGVGGYYFTGYIDDLRITKGVARYTAAFTPPSRQLPAR